MTPPDRLTIEEVEICCKYVGEAGKLARQLAGCMRELEALKIENDENCRLLGMSGESACTLISEVEKLRRDNERLNSALTVVRQNTFDIGDATDKDKFLYEIADKALSNKESDNG